MGYYYSLFLFPLQACLVFIIFSFVHVLCGWCWCERFHTCIIWTWSQYGGEQHACHWDKEFCYLHPIMICYTESLSRVTKCSWLGITKQCYPLGMHVFLMSALVKLNLMACKMCGEDKWKEFRQHGYPHCNTRPNFNHSFKSFKSFNYEITILPLT